MDILSTGLFGALRQYAGKLKTMRDEIRTERMINALPPQLRKDIGWPDHQRLRRDRC